MKRTPPIKRRRSRVPKVTSYIFLYKEPLFSRHLSGRGHSYYIIKLLITRDPISSTGTRQFSNSGKRRVSPMKPTVPLLCLSFYDFRFIIPNISFVKSKEVFWQPIFVTLPSDRKAVYADVTVKLAGKIFASVRLVRLVFLKVLHKVQLSFLSFLKNMELYHSTE